MEILCRRLTSGTSVTTSDQERANSVDGMLNICRSLTYPAASQRHDDFVAQNATLTVFAGILNQPVCWKWILLKGIWIGIV